MSRSDGSKPPAVEQDAFALQSVAWEEAIKRASRPPRVNNDIAVHGTVTARSEYKHVTSRVRVGL